MRLRLLSVFAALFFLAFVPRSAHADSIVYQGHSGNDFFYGLNVDFLLTIPGGNSITFTGLSDVTGVSDALPKDITASFTSDSATFTLDPGAFAILTRGLYSDLFTITSTAALGTIHYDIDATFRDISGPVKGPAIAAAVTPEPSSFLLLATGLAGMGAMVRRRFATI